MKKTILVVLPYGFNDRMTNFVEYVVARLLAQQGWRVIGLTRQEKGEPHYHVVHGIDVYRYRTSFEGARMALYLLITMRPSVVHVHTLRNNRIGIFSAMLAKFFRTPLAFSEAGLLHDHYLTDDRDDPLNKPIHYERVARTPWRGFRSYIFHWPLLHADKVAFFSKHNLPIANTLGLPALYLPQILDEVRWESASKNEGTDAAVALPSDAYALFVGQMKKRKGWDTLLRAIPHIEEAMLPKFVFVSSSGKPIEEFSTLAHQLGIEKRVVFLGAIPTNAQLRSVFDKSSVVVVPSRYEGFGLVPLEAFETKKPVIASRVDALTDFLINEKNSLLVPKNDEKALAVALSKIASDSSLRARLIEGGTASLNTMKSKEYKEQWLTFYDSLASSK